MQLFIGNKNYSTWSLRAWYLLSKFNISFTEQQLVLDTPEFYEALKSKFPVQKVPALIDAELIVWDSLAICEYINDAYLNGAAWPSEIAQRAKARSLAAEMHSGFAALRNEMPMNIRAKRHVELSEQAKKDIARIDEIFSTQQQRYPGILMRGYLVSSLLLMRCLHLWYCALKRIRLRFRVLHKLIVSMYLRVQSCKPGFEKR